MGVLNKSATAIIVLTIDGPSGSGKGTLARMLADALGLALLDSGALYRVLGLYAKNQGYTFDETDAQFVGRTEHADKLGEMAAELPVEFALLNDGGLVQVRLDGEDVSKIIRTEQVGALASQVAKVPAVRAGLLSLQRSFAQGKGVVADGRDMGTVVFPSAQVKVFLEADVKERAKRRCKQLLEQGFDANMCALEDELRVRDEQDRTRSVSPLVPADDAVIIDSTSMSIDDVFKQVMALVAKMQLESC